ncbi:lytic polysaccharide monooxygenase [Patellaria atrata CBS 101060]|uniref:AA9 family lytic polysaccharide monooxygenase n=1 Tax=Patellaria atrata CBS 101060 TaxID=1346257 RepID=A0A9P4SCV4_9PEZI|nr:lytic polysaccharide monooxygenase [Patellaria atrata CBS 101060]
MTCNFDGSAPPGSRSLHASVPAGGEITAHWSNNFTFRKGLPFYCDPAQEERVCPPGYVCDFRCLYHHWYHDQGPLFAYLASCGDDCGSFDPSSEKVWFKIAESGLQPGATISGQGNPDEIKYSWKQGELTGATEKDKVGWSFKIPPGLKKGKYLLRVEILSLQLWPPQFYPECAQIEVTGEGGNAPAEHELVAFPGAYSYDDPGISVSGKMWTPASQGGVHDVKNYTMPGPPVWTG